MAAAGPFSPAPSGDLVGREREIAVLASVVQRSPAVAFVEGEAGVGKSRLVAELLASPGAARSVGLLGRCHPLREPFVLGPLVDIVRATLDQPRTAPLPAIAGALRRLVPELEARLPPALEPLVDGSAELHLLFRAMIDLLRGAGPCVCVIEDIHWADDGTIEFLRFLVSQMPDDLSLVLTYRPEEVGASSPLRGLGARLGSRVVASTVVLAPLHANDVRRMVSAILAMDDVSDEFAAYLTERTSGIPFAVEEVLRLVQDRRDIVHQNGRWVRRSIESLAVPPRVRDAVLERVGRLGSDAHRVALAAAVVDVPAEEKVLTRVAGLNAARGRAGLCQCLRASVVWELDAGYGFRHALASQAVSESIPRPDYRRLHLRAARVLEQAAPQPVTRLVHHYRSAGAWREAASFAERAADVASAVHDHGTASEFLHQGLSLPNVEGADRARMAVKLGWLAAQAMAYHVEALPVLRAVADDGQLAAPVRGEIRALLGELLILSGDAAGGRAEQVRSLAELGSKPHLAVLVMSDLGQPRVVDGTVDEHLRWLERAAETAAGISDPSVRLQVLIARAVALARVGDPSAWRLVEEIPWDAPGPDERRALLRACLCLSGAVFHLGHYDRARAFLEDAGRRAEQLGQREFLRSLETSALLHEWATGHWAGLEARAAVHLDAATEIPRASAAGTRVLAYLALAAGALDRAERLFRLLLERSQRAGVVPGMAGASAGLGLVYLARDDPAGAMRESALGVDVVAAKGIWVWGAETVPVAVEALIAGGERAPAAALTTRFAQGLDRRDAPLAAASLALCEGLVTESDGAHAPAAEAFRQAREAYSRLPRPYDEASAAMREGRCHFATGDRGRGLDACQAALARYTSLGATADASRLRRLVRSYNVTMPTPWRGGRRGYGDELSPREEQAARLVAEGRTNREIAEALHLSPRTVEHHLGSAMRKLGVRSRTTLATKLLAGGDRDAADAKDGGIPPSQGSSRP